MTNDRLLIMEAIFTLYSRRDQLVGDVVQLRIRSNLDMATETQLPAPSSVNFGLCMAAVLSLRPC